VIGAGRHGLQSHALVSHDDVGDHYTLHIEGTGIYACYDDPPADLEMSVEIDGQRSGPVMIPATLAGCVRLADDLGAGEHRVTMTVSAGTEPESIIVIDYTVRHRLPWILTGIIAGVCVLVVLGSAVNARWS
jgi:hypothetical protein